jgi:putative membrane protein
MYDCEFFPFFGMPYGLGWVFMAVFWVFVIAGVIALVRWLANSRRDSGQGTSSPGHKNPTDILRERYARGEFDRDEFMQRLEDLSRH